MSMHDFFISYTAVDRKWAEWIAHQLEEAGYSVIVQDWDFRPGSNFVVEMQHALQHCRHIIAVLTPAYLQARFPQAEWASVFARDPQGLARLLIPIMVKPCTPTGLLAQLVHIPVYGLDADAAREAMLAGVRPDRAKPALAPPFPG